MMIVFVQYIFQAGLWECWELKDDEGLTSSLWYSLVNKKKKSVEQLKRKTSNEIKMDDRVRISC